jgi:hypothetical protein
MMLLALWSDRLLGGGNEIVEDFSRLLDALFRHLPHFGRDLEFRHTFLRHPFIANPGQHVALVRQQSWGERKTFSLAS